MLVTDITPRHCSRCHKQLTDPASREAGVGPVCRSKNNTLFAKTIRANLPCASAIVLGTHVEQFPPEVQDRWTSFKEKFLRQMQRAKLDTELLFTGSDFRDCVCDLDFMLSFHMDSRLQHRLTETVRHLGYPGLAGVLAGEASVSKAKVWYENGRVYLDGRANTAGYRLMRRVPGIVTPQYRGHRVPYSGPVIQVETFLEIVQRCWPLYEGDLASIRENAAAFVAANLESSINDQNLPLARLVYRTDDLLIKFPWVRGARMYDLINKIKSDIPSSDRRYDTETKVWSCKKQHLGAVKEALRLVFDENRIHVTQSEEVTPPDLYRRRGGVRAYRQH